MERLHFNDNDLPDNFKNIIVSKDDNFTEIINSVKFLNDTDVWFREFSKKTETSWIIRS